RRRHTRCLSDWSQTCALPILEARLDELLVLLGLLEVILERLGQAGLLDDLRPAAQQLDRLRLHRVGVGKVLDKLLLEIVRFDLEIGRASWREWGDLWAGGAAG